MNNFLTYINSDIELKKEMLSSMPTNNKTNIKKLKEKISTFKSKYNEYSLNVKKYIEVKSRAIDITDNKVVDKQNVERLKNRIDELQNLRRLLLPINTYYEKLEFDSLLYEISNFSDFDFPTLNNVIAKFIEKFNLISVKLTANDFNLSCYVYDYMSEFFKSYESKDSKYLAVEAVFERIYWVNPNIIDHIQLSFRRLIKKYENKFKDITSSIQDEAKRKCGVYSYEDCVKELRTVHFEYISNNTESITDIIEMGKTGELDVNDFFSDSKAMTNAQAMLVVDRESAKDISRKDKIVNDLIKLKHIIKEYNLFAEFTPFVEYSKGMLKSFKAEKTIEELEDLIEKMEDDLSYIFNSVMGNEIEENFNIKKAFKFIEKKPEVVKPIKQMQADSIVICNQVLELYKNVDSLHFLNRCKSMVDDYVTLDDFLTLYYGYDYFKKKGLKNTFNTQNYDELVEYSNKFDEFCSNPNNVVVSSIPVFEEYNVAKIIVDKYRINNINLTEDNLRPANITSLLENVKLFLRVTHILECNLTVEKLWFIIEAHKISTKKEEKTD